MGSKCPRISAAVNQDPAPPSPMPNVCVFLQFVIWVLAKKQIKNKNVESLRELSASASACIAVAILLLSEHVNWSDWFLLLLYFRTLEMNLFGFWNDFGLLIGQSLCALGHFI